MILEKIKRTIILILVAFYTVNSQSCMAAATRALRPYFPYLKSFFSKTTDENKLKKFIEEKNEMLETNNFFGLGSNFNIIMLAKKDVEETINENGQKVTITNYHGSRIKEVYGFSQKTVISKLISNNIQYYQIANTNLLTDDEKEVASYIVYTSFKDYLLDEDRNEIKQGFSEEDVRDYFELPLEIYRH